MTNCKFLEDEILRLRPVEPEDTDFMWMIESDSSQWIENSLMAPFSRENMMQYALTYNADPFSAGQMRLIIERKFPERAPIGTIDLYDISSQHRRAFIGIYILESDRGKGYAKRAISILENYAFNLLNLLQLGAKVADINIISNHFFESSGYILRGTLPEWLIAGNLSAGMNIFTKKLT